MQLVIGSDIHGSSANLQILLDYFSKEQTRDASTRLILLGDIYNHGPRNPFPTGYAPMQVADMLNAVKQHSTVVKGNCDSEVDEMISQFAILPEHEEEIFGRKMLFTHGHKCNPSLPTSRLGEGDVVFYGHFHKPSIQVVDGVIYVCVGAVGLSANGVKKSFAIVSEQGIRLVGLEDGEEIENYPFV